MDSAHSGEDGSQRSLKEEIEAKISLGEQLIFSLSGICNVKGCQKLIKRLHQEINFFKKVLKKNDFKIEHVKCTNLGHLEAVVKCALKNSDGCSEILETLDLQTVSAESKKVCVDVVTDNGKTWIKVVARNPKALSLLSAGEGGYGQRTVLDQAKEFLTCASQHPLHFKAPKVVFLFASGIETPLADSLEKLGVEVQGERISKAVCPHETDSSDSDFDEAFSSEKYKSSRCIDIHRGSFMNSNQDENTRHEERLNLDVTAMIAYVSSLTNGGCNFRFKEPLLTQQAECERERPAKPLLEEAFQGRKLFCCSTAHKDFLNIVETFGGPSEKRRADLLLERVVVVPDKVSERTEQQLKEGGKVKARSKKIFGTGDELYAVTVTANEGFVRAAKSQGVSYAVLVHESRSLSESKEATADPL